MILSSDLQNVQDHVVHHSANLAAIVIPTLSFTLNGPELLTYTTGFLGVVWYLILIGEKVFGWYQRRRKGDPKA